MKNKNKEAVGSAHQDATEIPTEYYEVLRNIKEKIRSVQLRAVISVNSELVLLYWDIGNLIHEKQEIGGWGAKVIDRLAKDLKTEFPNMAGFSPRNLLFMRAFREEFPEVLIVKQLVSQIPWGHIIRVIQMVKEPSEREWYITKTVEHGWSRAVLVHQIETDLFHREGTAVTNFKASLPPAQSDLAKQTLKNQYVFDFLTIAGDASERELECALVEQIRRFLMELGVGFAFVGSQYHFELEGDDFYIDLLFYHLKLRCFVVIDLKTEAFKPEFAGKMNFYLTAIDEMLKHPSDNPSIGIILCKTKKSLMAEYALRNTLTPIGVSEYKLTGKLPKEMEGCLPTIAQLETEMERVEKGKRKKRRTR